MRSPLENSKPTRLAELGEIFFAAAVQARFLKLQIAELLFVAEMRVKVDESRGQSGVLVFEVGGELDAALSVDVGSLRDAASSHADALQAPGGVGDGLDQIAFALADGAEFLFVAGDVLLVGGGIFGGKEDGAASEAGFEGVRRRFGFVFAAVGPGPIQSSPR